MKGRAVVAGWIVSAAMLTTSLSAQQGWDVSQWDFSAEGARVEDHLGRSALFLPAGSAWLKDSAFRDGIIEFDLSVKASQGFHGVRFRAVDPQNHEYVYLRPHLSDKSDAVQYTPIDNGLSAWQLYAEERYALPVTIPAERWVHVRLGIQGDRMELEVDGQLLVFPELVRDVVAGGVGITASGEGAYFANFVVRPGADPHFEGGAGAEGVAAEPGAVTSWRVSDTFAESEVEGVVELSSSMRGIRNWTSATPVVRGIVNLATVRTRTPENNTVFAAVTVQADRATTLPVRIGFSDRVRVFVNGRQIYSGSDGYGTRDYRFLGTIGLFDEVFLPLESGDNEVLLAVSEDFGGWGVSMVVPEAAGITIG